MLQSKLFTKTRKETPADEVSLNARLLIKAGFVDKLQAGVYSYLPLGFRVLKNIEALIREEMNAAGGQELLMPALHPKEHWVVTGRWDTMDDLYKLKDASGRENALGPTHEEIITPLAKQFIFSYKDLPFYAYQFQTKFRMELRAKGGVLRGREFLMKDLYSFHATESDLADYYEVMKRAYRTIFNKAGIGDATFLTFASGGSFSKYSHEFQTVTPAGEDIIFICPSCNVAVNKEIIAEQKTCPECGSEKLEPKESIEVGNIFELKTKFSKAFNLTYKDEKGEDQLVLMGCYGIGLGRLMGTVVEVLADERGIVWPEIIAPFRVHLIHLEGARKEVRTQAITLYQELESRGVDVLYDDRDISPGEKFMDADLIGIPFRVVVSKRSLERGGVELKGRTEEESAVVSIDECVRKFAARSRPR